MGRSFLSVRQGVNHIAARWERASKKYRCKSVARIAKTCSSEGFVGCNDPLESVLFSIGVEMQKEREKQPDGSSVCPFPEGSGKTSSPASRMLYPADPPFSELDP
jgi:hypothetical protein